MNESVMTAFVVVASIALVVQAGMLIAVFLSLKKTSDQMQRIAANLETRAMPLLDSARRLLDDTGPQLRSMASDLSEISGRMRAQAERLDETVSEMTDRARLQAIRIDDTLSRTLDRVEQTTEIIQSAVVQPVQKVSAVMQGISAGLGAFLQTRRRSKVAASGERLIVEDEELFI
jgi:methyl-accepting chemotaxis protein